MLNQFTTEKTYFNNNLILSNSELEFKNILKINIREIDVYNNLKRYNNYIDINIDEEYLHFLENCDFEIYCIPIDVNTNITFKDCYDGSIKKITYSTIILYPIKISHIHLKFPFINYLLKNFGSLNNVNKKIKFYGVENGKLNLKYMISLYNIINLYNQNFNSKL